MRQATVGAMAALMLSFAVSAQDAKPADAAEIERLEKQVALRQERIRLLRELRDAEVRLAAFDQEHGFVTPSANKRAAYYVATVDAIRRQWTRPDDVPHLVACPVRITQRPGGEVVGVEVLPACPYDADAKRSVEAAIRKASPLPYAGFEDVFATTLTIRFRADNTPADLPSGS